MGITVGTTQLRVVHLFIMVYLILLIVGIISRGHSTPQNVDFTAPIRFSPPCHLVLANLKGNRSIDTEIAQQQKLIIDGSRAVHDFERLAWTFVRKARLTLDPGYYKLAEQCALCIDSIKAQTPESLLLRAHVAQSLHRFKEAEALAVQLTKVREQPFDYAVLGDALIDQGKIHEGAAAYQRMVDLRPDLQSYARAAHVRWLTGDLKGAAQLMKLATSSSSPNDPNTAAWALNRLAIYQLQLGAIPEALNSCDAALGLQNDYAPALLTRARILWSLNRFVEALGQFRQAAELSPLPEYHWALADAMREMHEANLDAVEAQIKQSSEDPRTVSLYLSTRRSDLDHAVQLAEQELVSRQDVFTHDALAWALAASGRTREARSEIAKALAEGTKDARLYLHAAVIAALNQENEQARKWINDAQGTQWTLFPSERHLLKAWRKRILAESKSDPVNSQ